MTVNSCTNDKVTFTLTEAANGGIIYIQGSGPGCRHVTYTGSNVLEFAFSSCGIVWERSFRIVIQRKELYLTADDKIIPVTCIADLSDITVHTSIDTMSKEDETPQTIRIKPSAFMRLLSGGNDVSGKMVKLTDSVTLRIELHYQYRGNFDIKATTCRALNIPLIVGGCPTDRDLFPQFTKLSRGVMASSFKAFIPTEHTSNRVTITFTCTLDVCLNTCPQRSCPINNGSLGRKRRGDERQNIDPSYKQLHVDSTLVISHSDDLSIEKGKPDNIICIHWAVFAVGLALLVGSIMLTVYVMVLKNRWKLKYKQTPFIYQPPFHTPVSTSLESIESTCFLPNVPVKFV